MFPMACHSIVLEQLILMVSAVVSIHFQITAFCQPSPAAIIQYMEINEAGIR
jgi:hypothetical protein